jgi:GT2 family glycosyltransferase
MSERTTIVIPVFNQCAFTRKCLEVLARNTLVTVPFEVVIVDNGSTDDTKAYLEEARKSYPWLRVWTSPKNLGFAAGCNQGAREAQGEYLVFLNNDTEVHPDWLAPLVRILRDDPRVGAVGGKIISMDGTRIQTAGMYLADDLRDGRQFAMWMYARDESAADPRYDTARVCVMVAGVCLAVRRAQFLELGGFDEQFYNGYEDVDFCLRLGEKGLLVVCEPACVVRHFESPDRAERYRCSLQNRALLVQRWRDKVGIHAVCEANGVRRFLSPKYNQRYVPPPPQPEKPS